MEFYFEMNEYVVIGPMIEMDEGNVIDHTTSMACKPPNAPREMELIHAWVKTPNKEPRTLIDQHGIGAFAINKNVTKGLHDMVFSTLFPNGNYDWIGARKIKAYILEFVKYLFFIQRSSFWKAYKIQV